MKIQTLLGIVCLVPRLLWAQEGKDSTKEIEELKGIVDGMNESFAEYRTVVDALRKIKLTGYIQPQFRVTDARGTPATFSGGAFPANSNKLFQIREGRFRVTYDNVLTQYVLQIDATQAGVKVTDAFVSVTEPWIQAFGFQMGIFDRPFGYEISYSSSNRESPERARVFQTLFPGERDLGAKLFYAPQMGTLSFLRADLGVFNGTGPTANEFDDFKDLIGHVTGQFPLGESGAEIDLGVSGYFGNVRNNTKYLWDNGVPSPGVKGFVVDSTASNLGAGVERRYFGVEAQFYYDVPVLGGVTIRGEYLTGRQAGSSAAAAPPNAVGTALTTISPTLQPTGPMYLRDFSGWYIYLIQSLGTKEQIVLKYDSYDPNTNVEGADFVTGSNLSVADIKFDTFGFGFIHHWDEYVKFLIYYEIVTNEKLNGATSSSSSLAPFINDMKDNVFTFRTQVKF